MQKWFMFIKSSLIEKKKFKILKLTILFCKELNNSKTEKNLNIFIMKISKINKN